ncbi:MAG: hypothetical protein ACKOA5_16335, partial [Actinomycetota bacterium]
MKIVRVGGLVGFVPDHCALRRGARRTVAKFAAETRADFVYGDSLHTTDDRYEEPFQVLRPGWSPERLRGHNYVGDVVFATEAVVAAAGGAEFLATLSAHDRSLRLSERAERHQRIPEFLYVADWRHATPRADVVAVREHCLRVGITATCDTDNGSAVRVRRTLASQPRVAVIVPTRGTRAEVFGSDRVLAAGAIATMRATSTYPRLEYIA